MNNNIILNKLHFDGQRITYEYTVTGYWSRYFEEENLYVAYSQAIEKVSYENAVIPFLVIFSPIAWMMDATITVEKADRDIVCALQNCQRRLKKMYPDLRLYDVKIEAKIQETSNDIGKAPQTAVFFSGGVDAWDTLLSRLDQKPILLTIIGADIDVNNEKGKSALWNDTLTVANQFDLSAVGIESNFRKVIRENRLSRYTIAKCGMSYWKGLIHGLGIVSLAAPLTEAKGIGSIFMATTFSAEQSRKGVIDGNDYYLVTALHWNRTKVAVGTEHKTRQQKIEDIVALCQKKNIGIKIRACWKDAEAGNCCRCEKCYRTIMGLVGAGADPYEFGFSMGVTDYLRIPFFLKQFKRKNSVNTLEYLQVFWGEIQRRFHSNKWYVQWFKRYRF